MLSRKRMLIFLLGFACLLTSATYTFSYFISGEKVQNSVNLSIGNVDSSFIMIDEKTPCSSTIVNINGLIPDETRNCDFFIKNTGTLTSKVELCFDNFNGDGVSAVLPYLSYKLIMGDNSFQGRLKDLMDKPNNFCLVDHNNNPVLLRSGDKVTCKIIIGLDRDTPYTAENKTLKFNLNIYATQSNNPNWVK